MSTTPEDPLEAPNATDEQIGGVDTTTGDGWGDYPLDAVFVRTEQRTVGEVVSRIQKNRYILDPDFQREFVWPNPKQSKLIESCVMRIPLPVFYVAEAPDGRIIVVDGLQRLTTFARFLGNELRLTGLVSGERTGSHELEGRTYEKLPLRRAAAATGKAAELSASWTARLTGARLPGLEQVRYGYTAQVKSCGRHLADHMLTYNLVGLRTLATAAIAPIVLKKADAGVGGCDLSGGGSVPWRLTPPVPKPASAAAWPFCGGSGRWRRGGTRRGRRWGLAGAGGPASGCV